MACHGPRYLPVYNTWKATLQQRVGAMQAQLREAVTTLDARPDGASALADTRANLGLLLQGRAIHNPPYAIAILDKARADVAAALTAAGAPSPPAPWVDAPYPSPCLKCHFGIEQVAVDAFGAEFPHEPHVVRAGVRCTVCHGDVDAHGQLRLQRNDCTACHERIDQPMRDVPPEDCLRCHTADIGPVSDTVVFPHEKHIASGLDCALCHTTVGDLPHEAFARSAAALPTLDHAFCGTCHTSDVPGEDGTPPDGANCGRCHIGM